MGGAGNILSGGGQIYAGLAEEKEAQIQARITREESKKKAALKEQETKKFLANQELSYLKSGVMLEGSPLLVLAETVKQSKEDVKNIKAGGEASASSLERRGRAAMVSGLLSGAGTIASSSGKG